MLTPSLPHVHFNDTCSLISLGSNGSTKFLESLLSLIPFQRASPALVLECYEAHKIFAILIIVNSVILIKVMVLEKFLTHQVALY